MTTNVTSKLRSRFRKALGSELDYYDLQQDGDVSVLKLYFKILKQSTLQNVSALTKLINLNKRLRGELRMFPEENMVCAEIRFRKQPEQPPQ